MSERTPRGGAEKDRARRRRAPAASGAGSPLRGRQVAITGRLASMTTEDAGRLIESVGGRVVRVPGPDTDYLVVGQEGWPFQADGRISEGLSRAARLQEEGRPLEVVSERELLEMLRPAGTEAGAEALRLYPTAELARVLQLPASRIRSWVTQRLIFPVKTEGRLHYFDYRQVSELKMLKDLTGSGVSPAVIRQSLEELRRWLPEAGTAIARLTRLETAGQLVARPEAGRLAGPSGQLRLGFEEGGEGDRPSAARGTAARAPATDAPPGPGARDPGARPSPASQGESPLPSARRKAQILSVVDRLPAAARERAEALERAERERVGAGGDTTDEEGSMYIDPSMDPEEWYEAALALEEEDRLEEAAHAYQQALLVGGASAETAFNLGNVLYRLGRPEAALGHFLEALRIDPEYVEAWNNLASVYAELGRYADAIDAGRRAVRLAPGYPDAHYNLAEAYRASARLEDARIHASIYLQYDPRSEWAKRLKANLGL